MHDRPPFSLDLPALDHVSFKIRYFQDAKTVVSPMAYLVIRD
jgi:hypothetical protein